jgi:hypothetical protein
MPLFKPWVRARWLALVGAYFSWCRLSEYDREPNLVRFRASLGPAPHSLNGGSE